MTAPINDNDSSARAVLAAIAELGEATAAKIAENSGVAYSTTNKKLRLLEGAGVAVAGRGADTKVRWRLTDTGHDYAPHVDRGLSTSPNESQPPEADPAPAKPTNPGPDTTGGDCSAGGGPADHQDEPSSIQPTDGVTEALPTTPPTEEAATAGAASTNLGGARAARRRKGALHNEVLTVLQRDPDATFTVAQVRKKVDAARQGSGEAAASAGAVYNALVKAVADGVARQVVEKPATFQAV